MCVSVVLETDIADNFMNIVSFLLSFGVVVFVVSCAIVFRQGSISVFFIVSSACCCSTVVECLEYVFVCFIFVCRTYFLVVHLVLYRWSFVFDRLVNIIVMFIVSFLVNYIARGLVTNLLVAVVVVPVVGMRVFNSIEKCLVAWCATVFSLWSVSAYNRIFNLLQFYGCRVS